MENITTEKMRRRRRRGAQTITLKVSISKPFIPQTYIAVCACAVNKHTARLLNLYTFQCVREWLRGTFLWGELIEKKLENLTI